MVSYTGCDSGFGESASKKLSSIGFNVVSACLTEEGVKRLNGKVRLAIKCDVTKQNDINRLTKATENLMIDRNEGLRLWAVVNNAGIAPLGYFDWTEMEVIRNTMEVNFFGIVSVSKAMLPLLKKTRNSRIINISSVAGLTSGPLFGPYSGKFETYS